MGTSLTLTNLDKLIHERHGMTSSNRISGGLVWKENKRTGEQCCYYSPSKNTIWRRGEPTAIALGSRLCHRPGCNAGRDVVNRFVFLSYEQGG